MAAEGGLTEDGFLGGRLRILQPREGFRSSLDAVLLAAAVPAAAGDSALDIGCGAGVAALCLGLRVPETVLSGLELQPAYAALARENAARNGLALTVWDGDLAAPPDGLRAASFDHVLMNPPYFRAGDGTPARDGGREMALRSRDAVAQWVSQGLRRLRPGGTLTLIQSADRLAEVLTALPGHGAGAVVLPVSPRAGRPAARFVLRARKGGRAPFRLLAPLVLHAGGRHVADGDDFAPAARAVLREGAALDF